MIEYRREKRKTLALQINAEGSLIVKAPLKMPEKTIQLFVEEKQAWIDKHQKRIRMASVEYEQHKYVQGEPFWLLGKMHRLKFSALGGLIGFDSGAGVLWLPEGIPAEKNVENAYRHEFSKFLDRNLDHFANQMHVQPRVVGIKIYKSQWGSATTAGRLQFNLKLALAPEAIAKYVIIHELAHLKYMNHSSAFWSYVSEYDPSFEMHRKWLRQNGAFLKFSHYQKTTEFKELDGQVKE